MTDLYTIIYDSLHFFSRDIINIIAHYAIKHSKYTFDTPTIYTTMHYNKQLGIIYCASDYSYKLINYDNGHFLTKHSDESRIDISSFESEFTHFETLESVDMKYIIHFDNNIIISNSHLLCNMYILDNIQYVFGSTDVIVGLLRSLSCVHNQKLYIIRNSFDCSHILEYKLTQTGFDYVQSTKLFEFIRKSDIIQISANDDYVYVMESVSKTKHNIYIRKTCLLKQLYHRSVFETSTSGIVKIYKDRIFSYRNDQIHIYDILTMDKIDTFNVQSFTSKNTYYSMSISNDLLMLASDKQIMFYDVSYQE
jgi:hypothetical protein